MENISRDAALIGAFNAAILSQIPGVNSAGILVWSHGYTDVDEEDAHERMKMAVAELDGMLSLQRDPGPHIRTSVCGRCDGGVAGESCASKRNGRWATTTL